MNRASFLALPLLLAPGFAAAQSMCAMAPGVMPAAQPMSVAAPQPEAGLPPILSDEQIKASPALTRLASNGAKLRDLGVMHGLRGVFAQNGDTMQVFYLTPDGSGAVAGVMWDLLTEDRSRRNVTLRQVRAIPGVVPTVDMRSRPEAEAPQAAATPEIDGMAAVENTAFGLVGREGAPRIWMLMDPLCPHSVKAFDQLRPAIDAGQVQVAMVPIAVIGGQSPAAAQALLAQPGAMDATWRSLVAGVRSGKGVPAAGNAETEAALGRNMEAASAIGLASTPTMVWRDKAGAPMTFVGAGGTASILASLGVQ